MNKFENELREKLLGMRAELESIASIGAAAEQVVELDQAKVGRLSRMDALQAQAMSQASGRRREQSLRLITLALARIEDGSYGDCRSCEEPIDRRRLEFDPTVLRCIDCARKDEQRDG